MENDVKYEDIIKNYNLKNKSNICRILKKKNKYIEIANKFKKEDQKCESRSRVKLSRAGQSSVLCVKTKRIKKRQSMDLFSKLKPIISQKN